MSRLHYCDPLLPNFQNPCFLISYHSYKEMFLTCNSDPATPHLTTFSQSRSEVQTLTHSLPDLLPSDLGHPLLHPSPLAPATCSRLPRVLRIPEHAKLSLASVPSHMLFPWCSSLFPAFLAWLTPPFFKAQGEHHCFWFSWVGLGTLYVPSRNSLPWPPSLSHLL